MAARAQPLGPPQTARTLAAAPETEKKAWSCVRNGFGGEISMTCLERLQTSTTERGIMSTR